MKTKTFKILLTSSWVIGIIAVITSFTTQSTLPEPIRAYLDQQANSDIALRDGIYLAVGIPYLLAVMASYVGLYFWIRWARTLFTGTFIAGYALLFTDPTPTILSALSYNLENIACVLSGIVIAAMYWAEPIRLKFDAVNTSGH